MRKAELFDRIANLVPILERSGVKDTEKTFDDLQLLDGPGISRHVKWLKTLERACLDETEIYRDMSPAAWLNITLLEPRSKDVRALKSARKAVRAAWRARPGYGSGATK